jgi:HK97 family phage portal protein
VLAELFRAARPRTTALAAPNTGLAGLGPWQHAVFGTWSDTPLDSVFFTDDEAEGLPVITAFLDIATALVVQMGLHGYGPDGQRLDTDPVILRNPAPGPNRVLADWVREYLRDSILRGNYLAVLGDDSWTGWPEVMYGVPNGQWTVEQISTGPAAGQIWYTIGGLRYPARDLFHVMRNADTGQLYGRGLLDRNRGVVAASVAAERWAARYYTTGAVPPAQIEHPDPELTQTNADILKAKYNAATRNREALVTPAGTKVNPLNSDAEKAQLADTRRANDAKLAIACGIPGALLGLDGPSLTYRNIVDVFQQFITTTVMGYLEPLEQQLSTFCLPRGTEARFNINAVLRPDIAARTALAVQAYGSGLMTRNEGRAVIDLPPIDGPAGGFSEQPAAEPPAAEPPPAETPSLEVVA